MCGIFAIVGEYDKDTVINNFKRLQPRGPDDTKYIEIDNVFIGFHRLKIMDTSNNGNQPF